MATIKEFIENLTDFNVPVAGIRVALLKGGYSKLEVEEALPKREGGFNAGFREWLLEGAKTETEVKIYILDSGNSENVHRHIKNHTNIADLARKIWEKKIEE